jgi:hypothetical protein
MCDVLACVMSDARTASSIDNAGALALAEALKTNRTLTTLDLLSTSIQHDVSHVRVCKLASCLMREKGIALVMPERNR